MSETMAVPVVSTLPESSRASLLARVFLHNVAGMITGGILLLVILAGVFAPLLSWHDPFAAGFDTVLAPPSPDMILGGDGAGRDVWARLLYSVRFSIGGAAVALLVAALLGVLGGLIAGYFGGWFDAVASWLAALLLALPGVIVLIAVLAVIGSNVWITMAILGVLMSPSFYRLVYVSVRGVREELYVDAARVAGLSNTRIIGRHVLAVVRGPALIQAAMVGALAITIQAGLDFIGLGDNGVPTWGMMLNDAFSNMYDRPVLLVWPAGMIIIVTIALTILASVFRDELQNMSPRARRRRVEAVRREKIVEEPIVVHDDPAGAETATPLLEIRDLSVVYDNAGPEPTEVVRGISLSIARGEIHGLIGESGSGKTQTAWSVLGLLPAGGRVAAGSISFDGTDLAGMSDRERDRIRGRRIAYIPQEPMSNLDPSFRIGSQLMEPLRVHGMKRAEAKGLALELLDRVGIREPKRVFDSYPHQVSGGMAQRILIAGAISGSPDLLIADEPTTALDVTVQADILDLLRDLQGELGMAMLLVTHNFGVVADLCDRVSVMRAGRIVETGSVRSIFAQPLHPYTLALFDALLEDTPEQGSDGKVSS